MDAVTLAAANASAKKRYLTLAEGKRRRQYPLNLIPASASTAPTAHSLTKATGATAATVASGGSGYVVGEQVTLAGGTGPFPTVLTVTTVSSGAVTGASVVTPGVYSAQPANAVAQASSTGSGTGATFNVTWSAAAASSVRFGTLVSPTAIASSLGRFLGVAPVTNISSSGYYGNAQNNGLPAIFEWTTDANQFDVKLIGLSTSFTIFCNGQRLDDGNQTTDASGSPYVYSISFASMAPRMFRLFSVNSGFGGLNVPGSATVWKSAELRRPLAWSLGDSYTAGTGASAGARAAILGMAELLGLDLLPDGVGGSGWNTASPGDPASRINSRLAALSEKPDVVFFDLGYNDAGGNMTTAATAFDAAVAAVRAIVPAAQIVVFGPATPLGTTGNLDTVKTTISGRATAAGLPFVDVVNWVNANNKGTYTSGDNTHPNQAGHDYLAARRAQVVSGLLV